MSSRDCCRQSPPNLVWYTRRDVHRGFKVFHMIVHDGADISSLRPCRLRLESPPPVAVPTPMILLDKPTLLVVASVVSRQWTMPVPLGVASAGTTSCVSLYLLTTTALAGGRTLRLESVGIRIVTLLVSRNCSPSINLKIQPQDPSEFSFLAKVNAEPITTIVSTPRSRLDP